MKMRKVLILIISFIATVSAVHANRIFQYDYFSGALAVSGDVSVEGDLSVHYINGDFFINARDVLQFTSGGDKIIFEGHDFGALIDLQGLDLSFTANDGTFGLRASPNEALLAYSDNDDFSGIRLVNEDSSQTNWSLLGMIFGKGFVGTGNTFSGYTADQGLSFTEQGTIEGGGELSVNGNIIQLNGVQLIRGAIGESSVIAIGSYTHGIRAKNFIFPDTYSPLSNNDVVVQKWIKDQLYKKNSDAPNEYDSGLSYEDAVSNKPNYIVFDNLPDHTHSIIVKREVHCAENENGGNTCTIQCVPDTETQKEKDRWSIIGGVVATDGNECRGPGTPVSCSKGEVVLAGKTPVRYNNDTTLVRFDSVIRAWKLVYSDTDDNGDISGWATCVKVDTATNPAAGSSSLRVPPR